MKTRRVEFIWVTLIALFLALFLFIDSESTATSLAAAPRDPAPTISAVNPVSSPNNLYTVITITGTNFTVTPIVRLGNTQLPNVGWVSSTMLTATVPWGLNPGVYTLTVINPDLQSGSLANAFTVTQAIGVWTTGGPYGGWVDNMAVSPNISSTAFSYVRSAGLFRTQDAGDHWNLAIYDTNSASGVSYGIAPTNTLYFWGGTGLWRSNDDGLTFQQINTRTVTAFASDPQNEQHLWIGRDKFGVFESTNGGTNWTSRSTGLITGTTAPIALGLAVDPTTPSTLYVVYQNGSVYRTLNSGGNWTSVSNGLPTISLNGYRIEINPFAPNVLLYTHHLGPYTAYRSEDRGDNWKQITDSVVGTLADFAFSPYISGTVYAGQKSGCLAVSTDGGANWSPVPYPPGTTRGGMKLSIGLDPTTGLVAYIGTQTMGPYRSQNGGATWELANNGITGITVGDLAAVPGKPEKVFAATQSGYVSEDAGKSWRDLQLPTGLISGVTISPQNPNVVYIGREAHFIYRSWDEGNTWERVNLPFPGTYNFAMRDLVAAPNSAAVLYGGGDDGTSWLQNKSIGAAFRSDDYGTTWTPLTFTQPISMVSSVAVHPTDSNIVYMGTGIWSTRTSHPGKGIFRSQDGGATWEKRVNGIGDVEVSSLVIAPTQPYTIYAGAWLSSEQKVTVFKSINAGMTWTITSLRVTGNGTGGSGWGDIKLTIDPLAPNTLYAGAPDGLHKTDDGGTTWTKAAGGLGNTSITALTAASDNNRTIVYAATIGGLTAGSSPVRTRLSSRVSGYVQGGVYQQTTSHNPQTQFQFFLPLIMR